MANNPLGHNMDDNRIKHNQSICVQKDLVSKLVPEEPILVAARSRVTELMLCLNAPS